MTKIVASITISVDGYITGPNDGPDKGLGEGGERLHYWVFGGPWSYAEEPRGEPEGADADYLSDAMPRMGAVVVGRNMYEAAGHWGGRTRFGRRSSWSPTGRRRSQPAAGSTSSGASRRRSSGPGKLPADKDVSIGGGADVIRQGLDAGIVDEFHLIVAPVILGGGKRLFEGFTKSLDLENRRVRQSQWATFIEFDVKR